MFLPVLVWLVFECVVFHYHFNRFISQMSNNIFHEFITSLVKCLIVSPLPLLVTKCRIFYIICVWVFFFCFLVCVFNQICDLQIFFQSVTFPFILLTVLPEEHTFLMMLPSDLSIFVDHTLLSSTKSLCNLTPQSFLLFSPQSLLLEGSTLRTMICFELILYMLQILF